MVWKEAKRRSKTSSVRSPRASETSVTSGPFFAKACAGSARRARRAASASSAAPTGAVSDRLGSVQEDLDVDQARFEDIDATVVVLGVGGDEIEAGAVGCV